MATKPKSQNGPKGEELQKTPTGIDGVDEITGGGLPKGRPTLVCGSAGCGKTLLAMEFIVRGIIDFHEPGVFMAFEENEAELVKNVSSLGFDLQGLVEDGKLVLDHVRVERSEIEETGEYDLEGLFIRLGHAIDTIHAKRVVLDTIEALFAGLPNQAILRAELRRLFAWLKDKGVTAIVTAERGDGTLTRHGLEEYVADCVILLDHRVINQVSTRRLRVVKYRGSLHGTNEYPFLIGRTGLSVLPITSVGLTHKAPTDRVTSGTPALDAMLGGKGLFRGSSVLISGTAGTGKTSLAASFAAAACRRGERCLYCAFEESPDQIMRNMRSIGLDLAPWVEKGLLKFNAVRPNLYGLEMHLVSLHLLIDEFKPQAVVMDPITNLIAIGDSLEVKSMLTRLIDALKVHRVTTLFTSLTTADSAVETSDVGISSLMDTWLLVRNLESNAERNRALYVLKSRGMPHSNQVREFVLSECGIELVDVYVGEGTVFTGSARAMQQAKEAAEALESEQEVQRLQREIKRKRETAASQIAVLQASMEAEVDELTRAIQRATTRTTALAETRSDMARRRMADADNGLARVSTSTGPRARRHNRQPAQSHGG